MMGVSYNKVAYLMSATLLKWILRHMCFPVSFVMIIKAAFLQDTIG